MSRHMLGLELRVQGRLLAEVELGDGAQAGVRHVVRVVVGVVVLAAAEELRLALHALAQRRC